MSRRDKLGNQVQKALRKNDFVLPNDPFQGFREPKMVTTRAELAEAILAARPRDPRQSLVFGAGSRKSAGAPDLKHLARENKIPAKIEREVIEVKPLTPEQEASVQSERRGLRVREALRSQDPEAAKTTNVSLHVVDTPGGVAAHHRERQRAALELARGLRGPERKFALGLAREHASAKRDAQKRVPAGEPTGGRWTR